MSKYGNHFNYCKTFKDTHTELFILIHGLSLWAPKDESALIIGIKHGFPCINVCQVPREMLKTEAVGRGFQHLPRDLANVNVLENNV